MKGLFDMEYNSDQKIGLEKGILNGLKFLCLFRRLGLIKVLGLFHLGIEFYIIFGFLVNKIFIAFYIK